ncbi:MULTISPECIES: hypothetical protein [Streptomyces]|uniref:hypothetical protein n=1 Tax=Streptomyces TaxID=1883 RepID=UPI00365857CF
MAPTPTDVIAMLDELLGPRDPAIVQAEREAANRQALGLFIRPENLPNIQTKGCPKCQGSMYKTVDKGGSQWICQNRRCGHIEVIK